MSHADHTIGRVARQLIRTATYGMLEDPVFLPTGHLDCPATLALYYIRHLEADPHVRRFVEQRAGGDVAALTTHDLAGFPGFLVGDGGLSGDAARELLADADRNRHLWALHNLLDLRERAASRPTKTVTLAQLRESPFYPFFGAYIGFLTQQGVIRSIDELDHPHLDGFHRYVLDHYRFAPDGQDEEHAEMADAVASVLVPDLHEYLKQRHVPDEIAISADFDPLANIERYLQEVVNLKSALSEKQIEVLRQFLKGSPLFDRRFTMVTVHDLIRGFAAAENKSAYRDYVKYEVLVPAGFPEKVDMYSCGTIASYIQYLSMLEPYMGDDDSRQYLMAELAAFFEVTPPAAPGAARESAMGTAYDIMRPARQPQIQA